MPEGHTIHRLARRHHALFAGATLAASSPQGRFSAGAAAIDGRVLDSADAYGKHLFYRFGGDVLHVHLGLIGRFPSYTRDIPEPTPATRLVISNGSAAAHLSGPMTCRLVTADEAAAVTAALGPDPLRTRGGRRAFATALGRRRAPVAAVLLDQSVIAGIGNVYRSEILFLCGIHPATPANELSDDDIECLWRTAGTQLRLGLRLGRIITIRLADVGARRRLDLDEDERRYVYHRDGLPCHRCGSIVRRSDIGARSAWWCPGCQVG